MNLIYLFNTRVTELLEHFLSSAVPLIASIVEMIGLVIIVLSLVRATYHYMRVILFHDNHDFHHEMSSGLTTALEFLMAAEVTKTLLLPSLSSVITLAATFGLRALMSLLLHAEMRTARAEQAEANREARRAANRRAKMRAVRDLITAEENEANLDDPEEELAEDAEAAD